MRRRGGRVPRDTIGDALQWSGRLWQRVKAIRSPLTATAERRGLGLSAKLLLLTITFVMLAEVLIFVPSVANFRITWLTDRLTGAQLAALAADAGDDDLQAERLRARLDVTDERLARRVLEVCHHGDRFGGWHHRQQEFEPLSAERRGQIGQAGGVAARAVETGDEAEFDRIGGSDEHDWNGRSRASCGKR